MQCCGNYVRCQRPHERAEAHRTEVSESDSWQRLRCVLKRQYIWEPQDSYSMWFCVCRYLLQYQEPIPCEQLVTALCDIKQAYTQFGGTTAKSKQLYIINLLLTWSWWCFGLLNKNWMCVLSGKRPFGVSLLYMGWDKHYGFQLYQSDPSGNYGGWKATCIGNNSAVSETHTRSDSQAGSFMWHS